MTPVKGRVFVRLVPCVRGRMICIFLHMACPPDQGGVVAHGGGLSRGLLDGTFSKVRRRRGATELRGFRVETRIASL